MLVCQLRCCVPAKCSRWTADEERAWWMWFSIAVVKRLSPPLSFLTDMPLHVRRSSDPSLAVLPLGEVPVRPEDFSRQNPAQWSTATGIQKSKPNTSTGTGSLEQKVKHKSGRLLHHSPPSLPFIVSYALQIRELSIFMKSGLPCVHLPSSFTDSLYLNLW